MPDNSNPNQPSHPPNVAPAKPQQPAPNFGHIPITEELDSAKWTLPPIIPVVIGLVLVAVVVVFVLFATKDKPYAALAITKIVSAPQDDNTMAAVQVKLDNQIDGPLYIKGIRAEVEMADGKKYTDRAAPGVDGPRYMQAFPALQEAKADWLQEELKIPAKTSFNGVAIFSYPVKQADFDARKQITLHIQLYDRDALVVTSPPAAK